MRSTKRLRFDTPTDVVITDPCYFVPAADWSGSHYGEELPFAHITDRTGCGDGSFYVQDTDRDVALGTFAADTGQTTAAALDDVLEYNPEAFKGINPDCYCIIRGFTGTIEFLYGEDDGVLHVMGSGDMDFETRERARQSWLDYLDL